jgi:hypothetical protein
MPVNIVIKAPKYRTAKQLVADGTFPVSQTTLLKIAKEHGVGKKMGRTIMFSIEDTDKLYETLPCPSNSSGAPKAPIGSCVALSGCQSAS